MNAHEEDKRSIEERLKLMKLFEELGDDLYTVPHFDSDCEICIHYLRREKKCLAWKDGIIPEDVWNGKHDKVLEEQILPYVFEQAGDIL